MHISRLGFCAQRGTVLSWSVCGPYMLCRKEVVSQVWEQVRIIIYCDFCHRNADFFLKTSKEI